MSVLEIRNLSKRYGTFPAVQDVSLTVGSGEIVALVGPNGAGKSTVLKAIPGLIRPSGGSARVLGRDVTAEPIEVRKVLGYVPQRVAFGDAASAGALVAYFARAKGVDATPGEVLERVGLGAHAGRPARTFSGGMMQRLGLGIALLGEPALLVLDEPMVSLDPDGSEIVRDILKAHRGRGGAAIVATHILSDAETLADRICLLSNGRVLADDSVPALVRQFAPRLEPALDRWQRGPGPLESVYREAFHAVEDRP